MKIFLQQKTWEKRKKKSRAKHDLKKLFKADPELRNTPSNKKSTFYNTCKTRLATIKTVQIRFIKTISKKTGRPTDSLNRPWDWGTIRAYLVLSFRIHPSFRINLQKEIVIIFILMISVTVYLVIIINGPIRFVTFITLPPLCGGINPDHYSQMMSHSGHQNLFELLFLNLLNTDLN